MPSIDQPSSKTMGMKIKVCGMKHPDNIRAVVNLKPDYLGFIFYPGSPRLVQDETVLKASDKFGNIKKVGVFVNEETSVILKKGNEWSLDYIQLHGDESPEQAVVLKREGFGTIKVWRMDETFDFKHLKPFQSVSDFFLFDTAGKGYGGTGKKFNWEQLQEYDDEVPFFLSGGIGMEDIRAVLSFRHPGLWGVDVNSRMETKPGFKNIDRLLQFMEGINHEGTTSG
jgi:phosphoribosylanthranilate isomerase